jgi:hypothetical protein
MASHLVQTLRRADGCRRSSVAGGESRMTLRETLRSSPGALREWPISSRWAQCARDTSNRCCVVNAESRTGAGGVMFPRYYAATPRLELS